MLSHAATRIVPPEKGTDGPGVSVSVTVPALAVAPRDCCRRAAGNAGDGGQNTKYQIYL